MFRIENRSQFAGAWYAKIRPLLTARSALPRTLRNQLHVGCLLSIAVFTNIAYATGGHDGDDKRPLEHEDYDRWNTISSQSISNDGAWVMYSVRDGKGDTTLKFREINADREYSIKRGSSARFTFDGKFAVYKIEPDPELIKKLRKEKTKPEDLPKSQLEILELSSGKHTTLSRVKSFALARENSDWIAILLEKPAVQSAVKADESKVAESYEITSEGLKRATKPHAAKKKPEESEQKSPSKSNVPVEKQAEPTKTPSQKSKEEIPAGSADDEEKKKDKPAGTPLVLRNLKTGIERRFPHAVSYRFSKYADRFAYAASTADEPDADGVFVIDLDKGTLQQVVSGKGNYKHLVFDQGGSQLAFLTDRDDYDKDHPSWSLYLWKKWAKVADRIAFEGDAGVPEDWWISSSAAPVFSEDDRRLYFNTAPKPEEATKTVEEKKKDDEDDEPKAKLDIWHWQDPLLQPQQLLQAEQERRRSYRAVFDLRRKHIVQLGNKEIPNVLVDPRSTADVALGLSQEKYKKQISWEAPPGYQDAYLVDLKTGGSQLVLEKVRSAPRMSPAGKFITWWDGDKRKWFGMSTEEREVIEITKAIDVPLHNELHDTPSPPRGYGMPAWLDDDLGALVYDRFDIWLVDPAGKQPPRCVTNNIGRQSKTRFRYLRLDPELRAVDPTQPIMLSAFDETTKASGYFRLNLSDESPPQKLIMLDENISGLRKARFSDGVIFNRSTFVRCPDIWSSTTELTTIARISRINPQQHEYTWGTVELIHWKSADGRPLDGLLYKPDGFDSTKKHPLMVYFYERNSDNLHRYYAPAAGRSTINFSFYVSRGYLLFIPDIPYKTGFPGQSAANSILPGVRHLVEQGFVDEKAIGMQGHSWGGYQTAYLVTQTDMFACAESGAPVSNMTSAYGGIRWGSGLSRMFQYERTQSRIGAPLWEAREKYIDNSPLFFADKINTPLLILHNDQDGAVPWYQGIELFVAMRRLSKPAWLLNYNEQPHWVMKEENRRDFAIRMQQFFDHYLKGEPEPVWMAKGIPAVDKGKKFGLEPYEAESTEAESTEPEPTQSESSTSDVGR